MDEKKKIDDVIFYHYNVREQHIDEITSLRMTSERESSKIDKAYERAREEGQR